MTLSTTTLVTTLVVGTQTHFLEAIVKIIQENSLSTLIKKQRRFRTSGLLSQRSKKKTKIEDIKGRKGFGLSQPRHSIPLSRYSLQYKLVEEHVP
jgi:hypothetical protein